MKKYSAIAVATLVSALALGELGAQDKDAKSGAEQPQAGLQQRFNVQKQAKAQKPTQKQEQAQAQKQEQKQEQAQAQKQEQAQAQKQEQAQAQKQEQAQAQKQEQAQTQKQEQAQAQKQEQAQAQKQEQAQAQKQEQAQAQKQEQAQKRSNRKYGPNWAVGDSWLVEATNLQSQASLGKKREAKPVVWLFQVLGEQEIAGRACFEVKIRPEDGSENSPVNLIYVDEATGMLVRVTTQIFFQGKWRNFTESYITPDGKAVPVFGSIPSLPIDMPVFSEDGDDSANIKSLETTGYETISGDSGTKAIGDLGVYRAIGQTVKAISSENAKALGGAEEDGVEVELNDGTKTIRQIWQAERPWPTYSSNGSSESRLLKYVPQGSAEGGE